MAEAFDVKIEKKDKFAILRTDGYINNLGGEKISDIVNQLINEGISNFILNFEKSNVVNSIGISILIEVIENLSEIDGHIFFCNLTKTISNTFTVMGLTQFANIYESEEEAINAI